MESTDRSTQLDLFSTKETGDPSSPTGSSTESPETEPGGKEDSKRPTISIGLSEDLRLVETVEGPSLPVTQMAGLLAQAMTAVIARGAVQTLRYDLERARQLSMREALSLNQIPKR